METITFSLNASSKAKPKKAKYKGRDYLVAPMTMLVPGVLPGSGGSILYTEEVVSKNPGIWNSIPIVVNHPQKDGKFVSARDPDVLNIVGIGEVLNARFDSNLIAEGWFDV